MNGMFRTLFDFKFVRVEINFFLMFCLLNVFSFGKAVFTSGGKLLNVKVVEEPSNLGLNQNAMNYLAVRQLSPNVRPTAFLGPEHLRVLDGRCFNKTSSDYLYSFCPFHNVTQHEHSLRWNPYSGVLGVFRDWHVENMTLVAMNMAEGDSCNRLRRSVKVHFLCGNSSRLKNIWEPETCRYEMTFLTPLVCHNQSMLLLPLLNQTHRDDYAAIEGMFHDGDLTPKGYQSRLAELYRKTGFVLRGRSPEPARNQANHDAPLFNSLSACEQEYHTVRRQLDELRLANQAAAPPA